MDFSIRNQFSDDILADIVLQWGFTKEEARFVQDTGNIVYALEPDNVPRTFLRISMHHDPDQIQAELDWVRYLKQHGVNVAAPVAATNDRFLYNHPVTGGQFTAVCFAEAPGERIQTNQWTDDVTVQLGRLIGQMNRLTQSYVPPQGHTPRQSWDVLYSPAELAKNLPANDTAAQQKLTWLSGEFDKLPRPAAGFGLIHGDVHASNFFLHQNQLHLFDFDDCCTHWFACDLAHVLYYALWRIPRDQPAARAEFATHFFPHLWRGYQQENNLDPDWLQTISLFLEYRDLVIYGFICSRFGEEPPAPFVALRAAIQSRLSAGQPYVDLSL